MDGVGARLGRSSTRFAPAATAFSGPVRKWTKKWVPVPNPNSSSTNPKSNTTTSPSDNNNNGDSNAVLYKWTPIPSSSSSPESEHPRKRKFRYVPRGEEIFKLTSCSESEGQPYLQSRPSPLSLSERQDKVVTIKDEKQEDAGKSDGEAGSSPKQAVQTDASNGKPDDENVFMEEAQADERGSESGDEANENNLDLNLN